MTELVVIDSTCLYTFCMLNKHGRLEAYLGPTARMTLEVKHEVASLIATVPRFADLLDEPVWPECVELTPAQLGGLMDIAKSERRILGGFPKEDYGETSTLIWARDSGSTAIVDDHLGRYLAKEWGVRLAAVLSGGDARIGEAW